MGLKKNVLGSIAYLGCLEKVLTMDAEQRRQDLIDLTVDGMVETISHTFSAYPDDLNDTARQRYADWLVHCSRDPNLPQEFRDNLSEALGSDRLSLVFRSLRGN